MAVRQKLVPNATQRRHTLSNRGSTSWHGRWAILRESRHRGGTNPTTALAARNASRSISTDRSGSSRLPRRTADRESPQVTALTSSLASTLVALCGRPTRTTAVRDVAWPKCHPAIAGRYSAMQHACRFRIVATSRRRGSPRIAKAPSLRPGLISTHLGRKLDRRTTSKWWTSRGATGGSFGPPVPMPFGLGGRHWRAKAPAVAPESTT